MSIAESIPRHCNGEWHGSYGSFPAPGHSKGDRGCTVKDEPGAPDGVLINSFNDADPLEIKDECRRVGLLPPLGQANDNPPRETGHYDYVDRDGVVLYRTVRIEQLGQKKRFVAQLPDGRGGWSTGKLGDTPRVLYRLPDFAGAVANAALSLADLAGKLHLVSLAGAIGNELATFDQAGRITIAPTYRSLVHTAKTIGAGFIALDNVAHLFAGNENIRNEVAAFCGLLNKLALDTDGSVLFLGHPNKAGDSFSGSTAWENQVRSRLFLEVQKVENEVVDPDMRVLSRGKANYARNGVALTFRWHQWAFVHPDDLPPNYAAEMAANVKASAVNIHFHAMLSECLENIARWMGPRRRARSR